MGIHRLDNDPARAARWHCKNHLAAMATTTARLLSNAHWKHGYEGPVDGDDGPFAASRSARNERVPPPFDWISQSRANYHWIAVFGVHLALEFGKLEGNQHKTLPRLVWLMLHEPELPAGVETPFQPVTHAEWEHLFEVPGDPVATCRRFYALKIETLGKPPTWAPDPAPPWLEEARASIHPENRKQALAILKEEKRIIDERRKEANRPSAA